jgi:hypothetical protein
MSWLITPQEKVAPPEMLSSVAAWWDASHAASFTYSSGTSVSAWQSRIGSYTLAQANAGSQPTRSGTVNGRATVVFNGSNSLSVSGFDLTAGNLNLSVWAVFSCTSGGDQVVAEHSVNFNSAEGAFLLYRTSGNSAYLGKRSNGFAYFQSAGTLTTTPKALVGYLGNLQSPYTMTGRLNASTAGTLGTTASLLSNINSTLYVGARAGSSLYLNGQVCELGITTAVLTNDQVGQLETYLSRKWGLGF